MMVGRYVKTDSSKMDEGRGGGSATIEKYERVRIRGPGGKIEILKARRRFE